MLQIKTNININKGYKQINNLAEYIIEKIKPIDFSAIIKGEKTLSSIITATCNHFVEFLPTIGLGIRHQHNTIYLFNGAYWTPTEKMDLTHLLKEAAKKMGMKSIIADNCKTQDDIYRQIFASAYFNKMKDISNCTLINFQNGTLEVSLDGIKPLRNFSCMDFLKYQLAFDYDSTATAPKFEKFLNRVLPDDSTQLLLSEYLGYAFLKNGQLKLEKVLMLFGTGHNGKSVLFDVIKELFGKENFSSYSPQMLMSQSEGAKFRAKIEDKLLNFASECGNSINADMFKKIASGEPLDARPMYGQPYEMEQYAKLIFNANELPQAPEMTHAYFRRFIIIPFKVQIPEEEKDIELAKKIIKEELPGVFNWILNGLKGLLANKSFSKSIECDDFVKNYQKQSDSVQLFVEETSLLPSADNEIYSLKGLYNYYRIFCVENGYRPVANKKFSERLTVYGFNKTRNSAGTSFYISRNSNFFYEEKPKPKSMCDAIKKNQKEKMLLMQ